MKTSVKISALFFLLLTPVCLYAQPAPEHNLKFGELATVWDEAIPLGNGTMGALIWKKEEALRFSLDRADIWDLRPMKGLHRKEFSFDWIHKQVLANDYEPVRQYFDDPYNKEPAPSKIPGGGLEFRLPAGLKVLSVELSLKDALCEVRWEDGSVLKTFVHATQPIGWFRFENTSFDISPELVPPAYQGKLSEGIEPNSLVGDDLARLGYKQGNVKKTPNSLTYEQEGWGGFKYRITVNWKKINAKTYEGVWSLSAHYPGKPMPAAAENLAKASGLSFSKAFETHRKWWSSFWSRSAIRIPDPVLEKQWYLEQYKFGSTARPDAPPISLQAVWTADNGRIPPWKGDFHHDLNTQLSYWPSYSANHLDLAIGYLRHLDENKSNYKRYTRQFFGKDGLAVPGVTTLDGTEMGGWVQYSFSPTVSAWLAQHYYLQWKYGMDRKFLKESAYPWFRDVCILLENLTTTDADGFRQLPLSSSPEINDNRITAWFLKNTNYDLALMKYAFKTAAELAGELNLRSDSLRWAGRLGEFENFLLTDNDELQFARDFPYNVSHRHFSHLMAIHPLSLIRWEDGAKSQNIIRNTIRQLEVIGPDYWCGYSYSWLGNLYARAKDGNNAARVLRIFSTAFCLPNSFHANGDQTKSGYSKMTYRPFTLEGNLAFAAGVQEMLLQSHAGFIEVMPAVPSDWENVSFDQLRTEGAFLVSAKKQNGKITELKIVSEKGGSVKLKLPDDALQIASQKNMKATRDGQGFLHISATPGSSLTLKTR